MLQSHTYWNSIHGGRAGPGMAPSANGEGRQHSRNVSGRHHVIDPMRLRALAARKLLVLAQRAGELPARGTTGILLPPIDAQFLAAELGCMPGQAAEILHELALDGILVRDGDRWRISAGHALEKWPAQLETSAIR